MHLSDVGDQGGVICFNAEKQLESHTMVQINSYLKVFLAISEDSTAPFFIISFILAPVSKFSAITPVEYPRI